MRGWWTLFRWEFYKVARRPSSYVGFALGVIFCVLVMIALAMSPMRALQHHAVGLVEDPRSYVNGYFYSLFVLFFAYKSLLPLLAGIIPGAQIAGEAKDGTLRLLLTRPPSRTAIFFTKLLVSYLWVLLTIYFLIFFALVLGWLLIGGGEFLVFVWAFRQQGPWLAPDWAWLPMFLLTGFGASLGLLIVVAFSLSLSALTDNPVVAYVGALGGFFISSIIQRLPEQILHPMLQRIMPTTHIEFWHELYWVFHPETEAHFNTYRFVSDLKWCGMYTVAFLLVGLIAFLRKDIKS
ncbi:MAG: ABC transporter permease subunit [Myxococcota bacterium]